MIKPRTATKTMEKSFAECHCPPVPSLNYRRELTVARYSHAGVAEWLTTLPKPHYHRVNLSANTNSYVLQYLSRHTDLIDWHTLSGNPSPDALRILRANPHCVCWDELCSNANSAAMNLIIDLISLRELPRTLFPNMPRIFRQQFLYARPGNMAKAAYYVIDTPQLPQKYWLSLGAAMQQITQKLDWHALAGNPNGMAIAFLRHIPDMICWDALSSNPHPDAVELLLESPDKIDWNGLSLNPHPHAIKLLRGDNERVNYSLLPLNPHPAAQNGSVINDPAGAYLFRELVIKPMTTRHITLRDYCVAPYEGNVQRRAGILAMDRSMNVVTTVLYLHHMPQPEPQRELVLFYDEYDAVARRYFRDHIAAEMMASVWHPRNMDLFAGWGEGVDA